MRRYSALFAAMLPLLFGCRQQPPAMIELKSPAAAHSALPHLAVSESGAVVLSWVETQEDSAALKFSVLNDSSWSPARVIASGDDWFINWADFPSVQPFGERGLAAHWLVKKPGSTYSYDIAMAFSTDGGQQWSIPITPHRDGTPTEHGFVSLYPTDDGVGAIWLDGRETGGGHDHDQNHAAASGSMTLRHAHIASDGALSEESVIDSRVCDCCQTDITLIDGEPLAVYRDRSDTEIRDTFYNARRDGRWQTGRPVNDEQWMIDGCPVNGPAVDSRAQQVAVAWYTEASGSASVRTSQSSDGGQQFAHATILDDANPIGRVDVAHLPNNAYLVSWIGRTDAGDTALLAQRVDYDGTRSARRVIAPMDAARRSGFPQLIVHDGSAVVAWTNINNGQKQVLTRIIAIDRFF
ncbi:MAG: hypothetical protein AAGJ86_01435 [Pseudomonadota bacterium]